jgi:flavin-dependent dehydrogenase
MSLPERQSWDVAVLGGGPAGCAAALSLRALRPELSVLLVEATSYGATRLGEVLSPASRSLLDHLGVAAAFDEAGFMAAPGIGVAWGSAELGDNPSLFSARGDGWHLDRARFDAMLAREATLRGVTVRAGAKLTGSDTVPGGWQLTFEEGPSETTRFVIDATGRTAIFARARGARSRSEDRLAGFARFCATEPGSDPRMLVEASPEGWWYTAPLPGGTRVVTFLTDLDLARNLGLPDDEAWHRLLEQTTWIKRSVADVTPCLVRAADSRILAPMTGPGWLAAGDAAMAFDPLSSIGITKALRSGLLASFAAADALCSGDPAASLARYQALHQREWTGYLRARNQHYGEEQRFTAHPFWQRRHVPPSIRITEKRVV